MKRSLISAAIILLVALVVFTTDATITRNTVNWNTTTNNFDYGLASMTFASATESIKVVGSDGIGFKWERGATADVIGIVKVGTSTLNGDSIAVGVRYQTSVNGTHWTTYTLGTDSTTMTTTLTGAAYKWVDFPISKSTHGGYQPYSRVLILGTTSFNVAGGKVKVALINQ